MAPIDHIHTLSGVRVASNKFWLGDSQWAVIDQCGPVDRIDQRPSGRGARRVRRETSCARISAPSFHRHRRRPGNYRSRRAGLFHGKLIINAKVRAIQTTVNGWSTTLKCVRPGTDILLRAACAKDIAALNLPKEQVYWQTFVDGAGHKLNGQHDYILHFQPGGLPPTDASWSLTMGDFRRRMVDNPIHRYSVGGRSGLAPNADGAIDIYIPNTAPAVHESNWLPAPAGNFMLWLRVYLPGAVILKGAYRVPSVVEVK